MLQQQITAAVEQALVKAVASRAYCRYTGQESEQLVAELALRMQATDVLLTSSGTAAVELALRAAGVGQGDEVLLSAYDYPGNFWAIERVGARPVLVDTEPNSWRIDQNLLDFGLSSDARTYKALIASHLHGQLQDVVALRKWCETRGLLLIEDACQAVGGEFAGKPVGTHGHAGILSFGGGKLLSAGRGGALLTSDALLAQKARIAAGAGSGPFTMSELQATVVRAQLPWLDAIVATCRDYFGGLVPALAASEHLRVPFASDRERTSYYQAGLLLDLPAAIAKPAADAAPSPLSAWIDRLRAAGIPAGQGFSGFQRRSPRRCRHASPLIQAPRVAANTCTIHHSAALDLQLSCDAIGKILSGLNEI